MPCEMLDQAVRDPAQGDRLASERGFSKRSHIEFVVCGRKGAVGWTVEVAGLKSERSQTVADTIDDVAAPEQMSVDPALSATTRRI
jgi:hypothetical protein